VVPVAMQEPGEREVSSYSSLSSVIGSSRMRRPVVL
jgi:hypothetical protein